MKHLALVAAVLLSACGSTSHMKPLPPSPVNTVVVTNDRPVPVLCRAEINRARTAIDVAQRGMKLEQQNAMLRTTIAQKESYIKLLEAGIIGCGGKIHNR